MDELISSSQQLPLHSRKTTGTGSSSAMRSSDSRDIISKSTADHVRESEGLPLYVIARPVVSPWWIHGELGRRLVRRPRFSSDHIFAVLSKHSNDAVSVILVPLPYTTFPSSWLC